MKHVKVYRIDEGERTHLMGINQEQMQQLHAGEEVEMPATDAHGNTKNVKVSYSGDETPKAQPEETYGSEENYGEEAQVQKGPIIPQDANVSDSIQHILNFNKYLLNEQDVK
jgi:hypothetical protein